MSRRRSGKPAKQQVAYAARPFAGRADETEWVALREVVPAATAPLRLKSSDVPVTLSTVLPLHWPAMVTTSGRRFLALQVGSRSGDVSRDLAFVLDLLLDAEPGSSITPVGLPEEGPRLQDLLVPDPIEVTVHDGFDYWVEGEQDATGELAASMEQANASVVPTVRLGQVTSAYWCRMKDRSHLRWVLPDDEEPLLGALARLAVVGGLSLGEGTRFVGTFRAHGLLVPVWDLPHAMEAAAVEEPAVAFRARLSEALTGGPLSGPERRARAGLLTRQLTLR